MQIAHFIDAIKHTEPLKLPQNPRNGNVLSFPDISEARKVLKSKGEVVATGGLEPPTPAL